MSRQGELLFGIVIGLLALVSLGTSGASSMAGERSVEVAAADDAEAFLEIEQTTRTTANETTVDMTIANQLPGGTTLETVYVSIDGERDDRGPLGPGETVTVAGLECGQPVTIDASGPDGEVSLVRTGEC